MECTLEIYKEFIFCEHATTRVRTKVRAHTLVRGPTTKTCPGLMWVRASRIGAYTASGIEVGAAPKPWKPLRSAPRVQQEPSGLSPAVRSPQNPKRPKPFQLVSPKSDKLQLAPSKTPKATRCPTSGGMAAAAATSASEERASSSSLPASRCVKELQHCCSCTSRIVWVFVSKWRACCGFLPRH